jgi:hypothetical protein
MSWRFHIVDFFTASAFAGNVATGEIEAPAQMQQR